jgi:hypothetical protein
VADNVDVTPGAGKTIATDDIGGVQFQRVKIALGPDGVNNGDVSAANPVPVLGTGELVETLEALRMALQSLTRNIGQAYPDTAGRLRVAIDSITGALTLATITTVGTVTTVSTVTSVTAVAAVTNQTNIGGFAAVDKMPSLMHGAAESLRRNIAVT